MKSYFLNGGYIGPTVDFGDTTQHIISTTQQRTTLVYVGGQTVAINGDTTGATIDFALTGGIAAIPDANDFVVIAYGVGTGSSRNPTLNITTGYTAVFTQIFQSSTTSTKFGVWYKRMGTIPDSSFTRSATGNIADAGNITVHVWRGVDATTPFDVTTVTAQSGTSANPNPAAITPVTTNAIVLVAGASGHLANLRTYTVTDLVNFVTSGNSDDFDSTVGMGSYTWTSGAFDPASWAFGGINQTTYSNVSATMALRPALVNVPIYGNYKNSGIWNLTAQYDNRFYSYLHPGEYSYVSASPGTYYFVVPTSVTEISAVCIGGGGGGAGGESGRNEGVNGGAGGGLAYGTFAVTPNEILTVVIGSGGNGGTTGNDGSPGTATTISRGATVLLSGGGGQGGLERTTGIRTGGTSTGTERDGGGAGGNSGGNSTDTGSGGGGAGGYTGNGGAGGTTGAGSNGAGGGGGGGGATNSGQGYGGGGTSAYGLGTSGAGGALNNPGLGGSFGNDGTRPDGGYPGGGGGGCDDDTSSSGGRGGDGTAFIIWGIGRSYPSNTGLI